MTGWFKDLWDTVAGLFRGFGDNLPQVIVALSLLGWIVTTILPEFGLPMSTASPTWLKPLCEIFLAGGFFAWLTKSIAFRTLIRTELHAIVYEAKHLDRREDRLELLKNTLVANKVPLSVCEIGLTDLLAFMHQPDRPYHTERVRRIVWFDWIDEVKGLVSIRTSHQYLMVKSDPNAEFSIKGALQSNIRQQGIITPKFEKCLIERVLQGERREKVNDKLPTVTAREPTPTTPHVWDWNIEIPRGERFLIETVWIGGHDIDEENAFMYQTPVFAKTLEVEVYYPIEKMNVQFVEIGGLSSLFEPEERSKKGFKAVSKSLLLPRHGYIFTVQRHPRGTAEPPSSTHPTEASP